MNRQQSSKARERRLRAKYRKNLRIAVAVSPASGEKCVRCWVSSEACTHDEDGQALCERCRNVISHLS